MIKEDKNIKKIVADISDISDESVMIDAISKEGETDLAGFARSLMQAKNSIEPDRDVLLRILDKIQGDKPKVDYVDSVSLVGSGNMSRLKLLLQMPKILKFAIPSALVVLIAVAILSNPFERETKQVAELRDIGKDERSIESATLPVDTFISTDKKISSVDSVLNEVGMLSAPATALPGQDFFGINAITTEEQNVDLGSNLASYIAQEQAVSTIDATLSNL